MRYWECNNCMFLYVTLCVTGIYMATNVFDDIWLSSWDISILVGLLILLNTMYISLVQCA